MNSVRTCIVCRQKGSKENFVKFVYNKNGDLFIEKEKQLDGRGAYLCKNIDCVKKCIKTRALNRAFKHSIPDNFYEGLIENLGIK